MAIIVRDHRGGNWFWMHNAIITEYGPQLGAYGIAIYAALCCHAGQDQVTWVGQKALAATIGCSRAQVQKELAKLKELGVLAVDEQVDERGRTTNLYTLLAPPAVDQPPRLLHRHGGLPDRPPPPTSEAGPPTPEAAMINKTHGTKPMEQEPVTNLQKLWQMTLTDLAEQMVPTNYQRWLARTSLLSHAAGAAVVGVPDQISAEQLAKRFDPLVRRALADACGEAVTVQYQVIEG
jgi:biotin operon repressor